MARDPKAWNRWKTRRRSTAAAPREKGLTGMALEQAVGRIAQMFPGHVIREARAA